jgi:hypothetical protein
MKLIKASNERGIAAGALLGVNVAYVLALTTVSGTSSLQHIALLCCACSIPMLAYGASVELLKRPTPFNIHIYLLFIGTALGIAGFGCGLASIYLAAGIVFGVLSAIVIALTLF